MGININMSPFIHIFSSTLARLREHAVDRVSSLVILYRTQHHGVINSFAELLFTCTIRVDAP